MLRAVGQTAAADALHEESWSSALAAAESQGADERDLEPLLRAEDERLATAAVVADLLAHRSPAAPPVPERTPRLAATAAVQRSTPLPRPSPPAPTEINIADMIDSMIADECEHAVR